MEIIIIGAVKHFFSSQNPDMVVAVAVFGL